MGGGTPPQGGLPGTACEMGIPGLRILLLISFRILLLRGSCFPLLNPPPVGPGRLHLLRRSAALAPLGGSWAEKIAFQEAFKNCSNFDTFSTSIFERLGSVLDAQDGSQIDQKSIKIEFRSPSFYASFFTSLFDRFLLPTSTLLM